jgi:hypothetical protein
MHFTVPIVPPLTAKRQPPEERVDTNICLQAHAHGDRCDRSGCVMRSVTAADCIELYITSQKIG